jgi:O-antigen/teichoic acid export membrane protein
MLAFGGAVQAANTVSVLHQQVDKALLARYAALAAVAPYEVGLRVASAAASFPQFLMVAIQPTATAMHARGDRGGLLALHQRTTRWAVACAALLCAALVGGAGPLLRAWLGRTDTDAVLALQGLALASLAASPAGVAGVVGRAIGRPGLELEWAVLALTLHLAVALPLLPGLGLRAVLLAMVTANTVSTLWFLSRLAPQLGWPVATALREALLVPAIATAAGAGLGLMLAARWPDAGGAWAWGGAVAVGATAAGATAALLAAMRYVDWREARSLLVGRSG